MLREGLYLEEEPLEGKMSNQRFADTQRFWDNMYTKQRRIAEAAEKHAGESLSSVAHHIDVSYQRYAGCTVLGNGRGKTEQPE